MATTYGELIRRVMLNLQPRADGITRLAVEQAINDAHKVIACVKDFDDLMVLDVTHAATVADTKLYHVETNFLLVRPKDIYSIRLMDDADSRKLTYVSFRDLDKYVPYTEITGTGRPTYYTVRGNSVELYPIPDAIYNLYIQHSQWPPLLVEVTDETCYVNIDFVITSLATDMALTSLDGGSGDWLSRATQLLGMASSEDEVRPDEFHVAQPFSPTRVTYTGSYWLNPWIKSQPN
jgi:hypothetical protein